MRRTVVEKKLVKPVSRLRTKSRWLLTLECGHTTYRRPSANPPKRTNCDHCEDEPLARAVPG